MTGAANKFRMDDRPAGDDSTGRSVLLIGPDELPDATQRALQSAGAHVTRLTYPNDADVRNALSEQIDSVVVISRDDGVALRLALVVENIRPGVPLTVTVHSQIVATQLEGAVRNIRVTSMAEIVAPALAAPCVDDRLLTVTRRPDGFFGVRADDGLPRLVDIETPGARRGRLLANLGSLILPFEPTARILTAGLFGFLFILVLDTVATALVLGLPAVDAFYATTKVLVTVGPNPAIDTGPDWFKVFSSVSMIAALGFTAIFTAGLVNRLLDRRLTALVGSRVVPRKDHVVVIGLGQVGLRLALLLRELGVPVLAVESDPGRHNVARAKNYGLPVVIGRGASQFLLRRLSLGRARALAAVTSQEVENISLAVAALGIQGDLRTVLRAGRGEVINETRALFSVGVVRDVHRIGGTLLAAVALGSDATEAFLHEQTVYLIRPDGRIEPFETATRTVEPGQEVTDPADPLP